MYRLNQILTGALLCLSVSAFSQVRLQGEVADQNGEPLVGVTILEEGTTNGTTTDIEGRFSLEVSESSTNLVFRYLGFAEQTVPIGSTTNFSITMSENVEQLGEVVVTALGFEESKDELGYANSKVSNEAILGAGETTVINSLSGKSSGVRISRNSSDPGAGAYFQIRGVSSIQRDSQPLIVIDGVPISNDTRGNGAGRIAQQSRFNDINPNDIESITVLKGASAAALWGTQALGGVIMIKTKSGNYNQKMSVTYRTTYSIDQINRKYPQQTKFGQGDNGVYNPLASDGSISRDSWGDKIADRSGEADAFDTSGEFFIDQDGTTWYPVLSKNSREVYSDKNFDQIFQNGHFWENNLSVTGGNANSSMFLSIGDLNQEGIIRNNSDYRRTTARINTEHRVSPDIKINASFNYAKTQSNRIRRGASSSGLYLGLLRNPADFDISGYRGDYYASSTDAPIANRQRAYRQPLGASASAGYNNPLWTIYEQENLAVTDRFISTMKVTVEPTDWLDLIGRFGLDQYTEKKQEFNTPGSAAGEYRNGLFNRELARNSIFNMDYIAKASKAFSSDFDANLLVGFNYNHKQREVSGAEISNLIQFADVDGVLRDIDNALPENRLVESSFGQERTVGVYTSANLSALNMFFLNGTLRAETASTFGNSGNNTFLFPSASLAWQFTELGLLQNDILSFGKLRVSYGEVGVQPDRYKTSSLFVTPTYSDQWGGGLWTSLYGNGTFLPSSNRGRNSLKPERKKEIELGTDLRFLNDRLSVSATYFNNTTSDILLDLPIANSRGYDEEYSNAAEIQNKGFEVDMGYKIIQGSDWNFDLNFTYTKVESMVTDLVGLESYALGGLDAVNVRVVEGQPFGVLWGSRTLRDENGNIVFDANGFPEQDETEGIIGDPNPDWQGSAFGTLSYKNISLSFLFETYQGADIYAGTKSVMYDLGTWGASALESTANQNLLDYNGNVIFSGTTFRGKVHNFGDGPVALTEAWYNGDGGFFGGGNDELYIEDGSWTRLRELTIAYRLNQDWIKGIGMNSLEVSATGRNLFLWTGFEGNDPDTNLDGVSAARGIDYFNNPSTKSYLFTLTMTF